jgi:hypothetical protein
VLALVANSGNSLAPHPHFHVMDGPLSLASNGLPYAIDSFTVTGRSAGTEAYDNAEQKGTPLEVTPLDPVGLVTDAMPLDQTVVSFDCSQGKDPAFGEARDEVESAEGVSLRPRRRGDIRGRRPHHRRDRRQTAGGHLRSSRPTRP